MLERYEEVLNWARNNIDEWPKTEDKLSKIKLPFDDYGLFAIQLLDDSVLVAITCRENESLKVTECDWKFATLDK